MLVFALEKFRPQQQLRHFALKQRGLAVCFLVGFIDVLDQRVVANRHAGLTLLVLLHKNVLHLSDHLLKGEMGLAHDVRVSSSDSNNEVVDPVWELVAREDKPLSKVEALNVGGVVGKKSADNIPDPLLFLVRVVNRVLEGAFVLGDLASIASVQVDDLSVVLSLIVGRRQVGAVLLTSVFLIPVHIDNSLNYLRRVHLDLNSFVLSLHRFFFPLQTLIADFG